MERETVKELQFRLNRQIAINEEKIDFSKGLGEFREILTKEKQKLQGEMTNIVMESENLRIKMKQNENKYKDELKKQAQKYEKKIKIMEEQFKDHKSLFDKELEVLKEIIKKNDAEIKELSE